MNDPIDYYDYEYATDSGESGRSDSEDSDPDEIDLVDLCTELRKTYDVAIIDRMPKELRTAFERNVSGMTHMDSGECSKGRPVLSRLIYNYYNKDKFPPSETKPIAKFISGPKNLTIHWSEEYEKLIYIFGEFHVESTNCPAEFPQSQGLSSPNIMSIEDYLEQLYFKNPYTYTDIFAEFPSIKRGHRKYSDDITNFKPFYNPNLTLYKLFEKFKRCINTETRHENQCKLGRVHFFDIRTYNGAEQLGVDPLSNFFNMFNVLDSTLINDAYINMLLTNADVINKLKTFKTVFSEPDLNKARDYFNAYILGNPYNVVELTRLEKIDKENGENIGGELQYFIRSEINTVLISFQKVLPEAIIWLSAYNTGYLTKQSTKDKIHESVDILKSFLTIIVAISIDMYLICRIFKEFDSDKPGFVGATQYDQPRHSKNIVIYAGDQHSQRCRRFLNKLQFAEVGKTGDANDNNDTCINMEKIRQPFFTPESREPNPHFSDYSFNYAHNYNKQEVTFWDPMVITI
jgi:hypothetical protein